MANIIVGLLCFWVAFSGRKGTHFGEGLFGIKLIPWSVVDITLGLLGALNIYGGAIEMIQHP